MRWADMDMLKHVNNVTYLSYLQEARLALFGGSAAGTATVARHRVEFVAPMTFGSDPVLVDTWASEIDDDGFSLVHEVHQVKGDQRIVHLRAESRLEHRLSTAERAVLEGVRGDSPSWREVVGPMRSGGGRYDLQVRWTDLAGDQTWDGALFEYFQESRISYVFALRGRGEKWTEHVVARTDVDYLAPVRYRTEPYVVRSWIGRIGTSSFTIESELLDGEQVLARGVVVMVAFDVATQSSAGMTQAQRVTLEREFAATEVLVR